MNKQPIEAARQEWFIQGTQQTMQRAAHRAHELAAQTGTAIVVSRNGVIEEIRPGLSQLAQGVLVIPLFLWFPFG